MATWTDYPIAVNKGAGMDDQDPKGLTGWIRSFRTARAMADGFGNQEQIRADYEKAVADADAEGPSLPEPGSDDPDACAEEAEAS